MIPWAIIVLDAAIPASFGNYEDGTSVQTGLYQDREGYVSPGIKLNQQLTPNLYLNFAIYGAIWADHHGAAPTLNAGFAWDW
ncbi:MAG: hypothetical protein U5Q03_07785 [Bacteroidota bacterium]|nr:hypothetical protein [Bacteroidota bacterium]